MKMDELRKLMDPERRRAGFLAWKASLLPKPDPPVIPKAPPEMRDPIFVFDKGELVDIFDAGDACNPYAGGDYNGHCGGCGACCVMQAEHSGFECRRMPR